MAAPKVLAFAGSTRAESYNKKLAQVAAAGARAAGASVTFIDLRDYPLPLFDEDLEAASGLPENGRRLKDLFASHQGFIIASPEYNSSVSAVLKNVIDWVSRPAPNEAPLGCFADKVAALLSASPGAYGGLRGLVHLRAILGNIKVMVMPDQMALGKAHESFAADGSIKDAKTHAAVMAIGEKLAKTVGKLNA